jgi:membrane protein YqaA with SNARE-associated domain
VEGYLGLFVTAFLSATLLPMGSAVAVVALCAAGYDPWLLWLWGTIGNTLGGLVNWALGRWLLHWQDRPWFPFKPDQLRSARGWYSRWGVWTLTLSWLPLVGDPLTFVAGLMRAPFWLVTLLTASGKGARYAVLLVLYDTGMEHFG